MRFSIALISLLSTLLSSIFISPTTAQTTVKGAQPPPNRPPVPASHVQSPYQYLRPDLQPATVAAELKSSAYSGRYVTAPENLPVISVTTPASGTAPGYIFLATFFAAAKPSFLMIVDDAGELVYYKAGAANLNFTDFKRQPSGSLTYFEGNANLQGIYRELNSSYELTASWQAGVPFLADVHDLQLLPNGHALLLTYDAQPRDLSAFGALTNTTFVDTLVQEVDSQQNVYFSWRTSDYITVTDSYENLVNTPYFDHSHGNAVELDTDGNILLSSRHLAEITKINRQTGQIMWRLGGKQNQFNFTNDAGFSYQHDIRRLPNGHITLWDNGNLRTPPQYSRAVEYEIDEVNKVITRTWEYRNTPDVNSVFMGDIQRLPNGNSFLGWGGPRILGSEVGPDGSKRLEMTIDGSAGLVYRWFRFPWQGTPVTTPTLVLTDGVAGVPTLYYSWNGATEVGSYRIESGQFEGQFTDAVTQTKTGFENSMRVSDLPANACYYRVMPIDKNGLDTRYSDTLFRGVTPCPPIVGIAGVSATNNSPKVQGAAVQFTASITAGNYVSYTWDFGDGALGADSTNITTTHSYAVAGLYTATVTATNDLGSVVATTSVTITPPEVGITGLKATNDSPKVEGEAVQFTASVTAGTHVSYSWDFGNDVLGSGITPTHSYTLAGNYTATVTATNSISAVVATTRVTITVPVNNDLSPALNTGFSGRFITYTLIVTNGNPSRLALGVVVSGSIPANTALSSTNGISVSMGGDYGLGYVKLSPVTLAPGEQVTLTWIVRISNQSGEIATRGHVTSENAIDPLDIPSLRIYQSILPLISIRR